MKAVKNITIALTILVIGLICSSAYGQVEIADGDKWQISVTPYFWAPDVDVKSTVSGSTAKLDLSFSDILDDFDVFGFSIRVEMWKGEWGLFFDGAYVDLDGDFKLVTTAPVINVDVSIEDAVFDFGVAYKLFEMPLGDSGTRVLVFEPLGGVRYHYLKQEIKLGATHPIKGPVGTTLGGEEDWVELIIGARIRHDLAKKLTAVVRTDFGGFGIGSASKLTWNLVSGIDWQFKKNMSLKVAYRVMDIDYSRHSGGSEFGLDGKMQGPMFGLTILF